MTWLDHVHVWEAIDDTLYLLHLAALLEALR